MRDCNGDYGTLQGSIDHHLTNNIDHPFHWFHLQNQLTNSDEDDGAVLALAYSKKCWGILIPLARTRRFTMMCFFFFYNVCVNISFIRVPRVIREAFRLTEHPVWFSAVPEEQFRESFRNILIYLGVCRVNKFSLPRKSSRWGLWMLPSAPGVKDD